VARLHLNGRAITVDADPAMPLLWVLRDRLGLVGTRYGCGEGLCGACTVLCDGRPIRACQTSLAAVGGRALTTVEGLAPDGAVLRAWIELDVAQCGYCQAGQMLAATALLVAHPEPSEEQIHSAMRGQLCRCGSYPRIRSAIHRAAELTRKR
jgi:isoquinoline 1-oxidoreductase alpha subunit